MLAFDWRYTLAESDLPKVCDTTRLAGLNVGFPMPNEALLDFSLQLPLEYKLWASRHDGLRAVATDALNSLAIRNICAPPSSAACSPSGCKSTPATTAKWCGF